MRLSSKETLRFLDLILMRTAQLSLVAFFFWLAFTETEENAAYLAPSFDNSTPVFDNNNAIIFTTDLLSLFAEKILTPNALFLLAICFGNPTIALTSMLFSLYGAEAPFTPTPLTPRPTPIPTRIPTPNPTNEPTLHPTPQPENPTDTQTLGLSDSLTASTTPSRGLTGTEEISDSLSPKDSSSRSLTETIKNSDSLSREVSLSQSLDVSKTTEELTPTKTVGISDSVSAGLSNTNTETRDQSLTQTNAGSNTISADDLSKTNSISGSQTSTQSSELSDTETETIPESTSNTLSNGVSRIIEETPTAPLNTRTISDESSETIKKTETLSDELSNTTSNTLSEKSSSTQSLNSSSVSQSLTAEKPAIPETLKPLPTITTKPVPAPNHVSSNASNSDIISYTEKYWPYVVALVGTITLSGLIYNRRANIINAWNGSSKIKMVDKLEVSYEIFGEFKITYHQKISQKECWFFCREKKLKVMPEWIECRTNGGRNHEIITLQFGSEDHPIPENCNDFIIKIWDKRGVLLVEYRLEKSIAGLQLPRTPSTEIPSLDGEFTLPGAAPT